jgi:hypothetical protein
VVTTPDGVLYTAQIPLRMDGSIETGDIAAQAKLTFNNLKLTVEAAGRHALIIGLMRLSQNMPFVAPQSGVIEIIRPRLGPDMTRCLTYRKAAKSHQSAGGGALRRRALFELLSHKS